MAIETHATMQPLTTYQHVEQFLNGFINYERLLGDVVEYNTKTFDIEAFRAFLRELGDPHLKYHVIHVAGTKGKGSTCAFVASILREAGYKVGLYTSPHIEKYTERIAVNGENIAEERLAELLQQLRDRMLAGRDTEEENFRTVFELLTAAAFLHFDEENVDIAVIETGLGGRLDSTNMFETPGPFTLTNVITPIAFDHTNILGSTISRIATEKAGILKGHAAAVLARQPAAWRETVRGVVGRKAMELSSKLFLEAGHIQISDVLRTEREVQGTFSLREQDVAKLPNVTRSVPLTNALRTGIELSSTLLGEHQLDNLRTALAVIVAVESQGLTVDAPAITRGAASARWPGRFEIVSAEPLVIVDGSHCKLSATAMTKAFYDMFGRREVVIVIGFMRDKAAQEMCEAVKMMQLTACVCCTPPSPRALDAEKTAELAARVFDVPVAAVSDPSAAVEFAMSQLEEGQALLVFGSMFLIGPAKRAVTAALARR